MCKILVIRCYHRFHVRKTTFNEVIFQLIRCTDLELCEWRLLLNAETAHFLMIHQVKMDILSNLALKVFITSNLNKTKINGQIM